MIRNKNNLTAVFCLLELFVYIELVTWTRLSRNAQFTGFHYLPISTKIFANILHLSFQMKLRFLSEKMSLKCRSKSTKLVDIIGFAWNNA